MDEDSKRNCYFEFLGSIIFFQYLQHIRSTVIAEGSADSRFGGSILVILKQVLKLNMSLVSGKMTHLDSSIDSQLTFHTTT